MRPISLVHAALAALLLCAATPGARHAAVAADAAQPGAATPQADTTQADPGAPVVSDAWVRRVPPAARMTAAYLDIHNPGPDPVVVIGADSPLFGMVEMHATVTVDGMSRMREQERVEIPAGETVSFEPGGLHLMLMQATHAIPSSGEIPFTLVLEDGRSLDFSATVGQPDG